MAQTVPPAVTPAQMALSTANPSPAATAEHGSITRSRKGRKHLREPVGNHAARAYLQHDPAIIDEGHTTPSVELDLHQAPAGRGLR